MLEQSNEAELGCNAQGGRYENSRAGGVAAQSALKSG
jgi:hypothetical protein